jgi:DNA end-binding protein Ku
MRAIWKGSISFGLVNIPVGLYSATRAGKDVKLRMVRAEDQSPIRYKRVAEADEKEVPWDQISKAYEYEKGHFITITEQDFERVNIKSNQTVDIKEFVDLKEIDPMYFDAPYYLAPEKGGDKAYTLLREALKKAGKVGVAKVVIKTREHLAAVKPCGHALLLELMHFPDELVDADELPLPRNSELGKKEMDMAESLIETMSGKWEPEKYKDEYVEALTNLIEEKIEAGGKEAPSARKVGTKSTKVIDLVAVLQESLKQTQGEKKKVKSVRKSAHHAQQKKAA